MTENTTPIRKGSYQRRKQLHRHDPDRKRVHEAGNPTPGINVHRVGLACDTFFQSRGFTPSISKILQTRGVVIGVTKWTSRLKDHRDRHAAASKVSGAALPALATDGVGHDSGQGASASESKGKGFDGPRKESPNGNPYQGAVRTPQYAHMNDE